MTDCPRQHMKPIKTLPCGPQSRGRSHSRGLKGGGKTTYYSYSSSVYLSYWHMCFPHFLVV